jgi:hypothetical protein
MPRKTTRSDEAHQVGEAAAASTDAAGADQAGNNKPKKAVKAPKASKPRKSSRTKATIRMRVRWAVVNDSLKQIAIFDYAQRGDADQKAADLTGKGKGHHFVRLIKEPMPEPVVVS